MRTIIVAVSLAVAASAASGQATKQAAPRWKEIGKTTSGNLVFVEPRTISTKNGIVTATVRVTYAEPVKTPKGPINGSRAVAMFDCAKQTIAVKENIIWHDEKAGTMYSKSVPKQPGFGPAFPGTFAQVAMDYLCAPKPGS